MKKDQSNQKPPFLDQLFKELEMKKQCSSLNELPTSTVYKGFKTIPIQKLEPRKLYKQHPISGQSLWRKDLVKNLLCYKESCPLSFQNQNGFFKAFYEAYTEHGDIKITPDDVWLTIMLFFSKYVDNNAEQLRKAFVHHEGKHQIIIETHQKGDKNWKEFFEQLIVKIRQLTVKGVTENLECSFSSTDEFSHILSTAMIMNAYQKYFDYTNMMCICGIQNIHMGGNLKDWENLQKKLSYLKQFDVNGQLKKYVDRLLPVLDQFTETYKGNAHIQFWNNIYTERKQPKKNAYFPSFHINGWIIRFFTTSEELGEEVSIEEIDVPIKLVNALTGTEKQLYLVGGCRGVSVEDKIVYRPHFSYAIVQKRKEDEKNQHFY